MGAIGFEPVTVDRAIQHHRRNHAGHAEAGDQCRGLGVTMREAHPQPLTFGTAAMAAGHVDGCPCFIDKDKALGLQIELTVEPVLPLPQNVGQVLLDGVRSLFLRVIPSDSMRSKNALMTPKWG